MSNSEIDELVSIIQCDDFDQIESARDWVEQAQVDKLVEHYWELKSWDQKCALIEIIQDQYSQNIQDIMLDYLRAPYGLEEDRIELGKAVALGFIDEKYDTFMIYYQDRERLKKDVSKVLAENDLTLTGEPATQNTPAAPDPAMRHGAVPVSKFKPDIHYRGPDGITQLHKEASGGRIENIVKLLDAGVDIDASDGQGRTALFNAASNGQLEATKILVDRGANMHLGLTTMVGDEPDGRTPVSIAATYGKTGCVEVLVKAGCDPDTFSNGQTLLMIAAVNNFYDVAELLIGLGADVIAQQKMYCYNPKATGYTPLIHAVRKGLPQMVKLFLKEGADPDYRVMSDPPMYVHEFNVGRNSEKIRQLLKSAGVLSA